MKPPMLAALALLVSLLALASARLHGEHRPAGAVQVAQAFIAHLQAGRFPEAFALTVQQGQVGRTPEALREVAGRELCRVDRLVSTFPFQSRGNRLRRWVMGREVEMPLVQVEFAGACLLGVSVRRTAQGEWRVQRFAGHAG